MNHLWTVTKNEFYRYFISPLAYVYLISFLVLNGSFAIYFGHFFERGQADLLSMFGFQPWLYLLFIPGISMRLWAEEFRTKTIVQIITMPVSITALVWGKFFASWLFCALALLLTFPFWLSVNWLGTPDNTVILISYLGSFLLAGCMLAISQTMSALTKNQVIALVLSVIANLVFFLSGIEYILGLFRSFAPLPIIDMIASFSFLTHFDTIIRGLIEARDIVFFITLILLFNFTTVLIISFKTSGTTPWLKSPRREYYILAFVFLLAGFTGINLLANNTLRRFQYDFTAEKLFTLTDSTRRILKKLPAEVTAKLYYSPVLGERNSDLRLLFDKVRILLQRYAALSDGKFTYRIYNPLPLSDIEDQALSAGLQPLPLVDTNSNAYFGLTFTDELENRQVLPFFPLERQNLLEQDLTKALYLLNRSRPTLGLISSLPMYENVIENVATAKWEIISQLEQFYNIEEINDENLSLLNNLNLLMIAHPRNLSPQLQKAILDFSYRGGKILLLMDVASEAPRFFAPTKEEMKPSELGILPQQWGFKFHDEAVVADLENSSTIDATVNYQTNPSFTQDLIQFYLTENNFNHDFHETALLKKMMFTSAGVFTPLSESNTYFIPLLQPSKTSALLPSSVVYQNIHPAEILRRFQPDANPKYLSARIISKDPAKPFELIVVGDSDFLYDNYWTVHRVIFENNYAVPVLDNANFVLNALDVLQGNDALIGLRGKSARSRIFQDIETRRKHALQQFKIQEKDIFDNINRTKRGLQEIWGKKNFEGRQNFTPDELAVIAGIRKTLENQRRQLFQIRQNLSADIKNLSTRIKFINIYAVPLLILLGLFSMLLPRRRRVASAPMRFNRRLAALGVISSLLLLSGIAAVYFNNSTEVSTFEGKPVFPELAGQINRVNRITLQNSHHTLNFYREGDLWKLQEAPLLLVYQDRIRSFLSALLEAAYYEKKSANLENLPHFNLSPLDTPGSKATRIELADGQQPLVAFDIGKYNLELGRGAQGAYLRFDDRFQVWLVNLDVVDLNLQIENWTYSTIWNLRFGRLQSANSNNNSTQLADLAKVLLNTPLQPAKACPAEQTPLKTVVLKIEGDAEVSLHFFLYKKEYYLRYDFDKLNQQNSLQNFAAFSGQACYQISAPAWENLNHVLTDL